MSSPLRKVDRAPAWCLGGRTCRFESSWGFFLCPTLVTDHFIFIM